MAVYRLCVKDEIYAKLVEKARTEGKSLGAFINELIKKALEE